jgi:aryl-alcohol dehydrogenase-like predicted oxidoreductase
MSTILRPFGRTGLMVSPVTLDTMEFGSKVDEAEAGKLFAQALDAGVNVLIPRPLKCDQ